MNVEFDEMMDGELELDNRPMEDLDVPESYGSPEAAGQEAFPNEESPEDSGGLDVGLEADAPDAISGEVRQAETGESPAAGEGSTIHTSFGTVTDRLSAIAETIDDSTLPLDDALDLLEEAVSLGMQASSLLDADMEARNAEDEQGEGLDDEGAEESGDDGPGSDS